MNAKPWDGAGQARKALQGIAADPQYGALALSQPAVMSNLLKDLLPDEPREANLLVAAAQADLAGALRGYAAQGLDAGTAINLTASSFVTSTSHTPEACTWVVTEIALALGMDPSAARPAQATVAQPQPGQPTLPAAVNAAFNQATPPPYSPVSPAQPGQPAPASPWQQSPWTAQPQPARPAGSGSVAAGIFGFAGALMVLIACFVPLYAPSGQPSFSVFLGFGGAPASFRFWFAIQPVVTVLIAVVAGIVIVAPGSRPRAKAIFEGMLLLLGIQSILLFGFDGFGLLGPGNHGAGGVLGILGGIALLTGGAIGIARGSKSPAAGPGPAATPSAGPAPGQVRPGGPS